MNKQTLCYHQTWYPVILWGEGDESGCSSTERTCSTMGDNSGGCLKLHNRNHLDVFKDIKKFYMGDKIVILQQTGIIRYWPANNEITLLSASKKINSKWIKDLKISFKILKLLKENWKKGFKIQTSDKRDLPTDPAVLLLGIYTKATKITLVFRNRLSL